MTETIKRIIDEKDVSRLQGWVIELLLRCKKLKTDHLISDAELYDQKGQNRVITETLEKVIKVREEAQHLAFIRLWIAVTSITTFALCTMLLVFLK